MRLRKILGSDIFEKGWVWGVLGFCRENGVIFDAPYKLGELGKRLGFF